ncbi:MAG: ParA family protein [Eggerthellaceae bacterium]|nr:ParA family protein [Eggerthellaceae bacterium]
MGAPADDRAGVLAALAPVTVIVGHYGVGKTTLALNLARDAARAGYEAVLCDLDVVNPYFRSSEYRGALEEAGARLVAPVFSEAGTSLDVPSLTGGVQAAVQRAYAQAGEDGEPAGRPVRVIIDAGGDDAGATALGRFAPLIAGGPHALWYVANPYRNLTPDAAEAVGVLREVEAKARLRATGVAANPHLKADTDAGVVARGVPFAREVAAAAGLPLVLVTAPDRLARRETDELREQAGGAFIYPVESLVRTPWEA